MTPESTADRWRMGNVLHYFGSQDDVERLIESKVEEVAGSIGNFATIVLGRQ